MLSVNVPLPTRPTSLDFLLGDRQPTAVQSQNHGSQTKEWSPQNYEGSESDIGALFEAHPEYHAVLIPPATITTPHAIPFFPVRPSITTIQSPAMYTQLLLSIYIGGYLPQETHASPAVTLESEFWTMHNGLGLSPRALGYAAHCAAGS